MSIPRPDGQHPANLNFRNREQCCPYFVYAHACMGYLVYFPEQRFDCIEAAN